MFVRNTDPNPRERYYADTFLTKPTTSETVFDSFASGLMTPLVAAGDVQQLFEQRPEGNPLRNMVDGLSMITDQPDMGWTQWAANGMANMVGFGLNPITWGFGRAGGIAAEAVVGAAVKKVAPEAVTAFMRKPLAEVFGEKLGKYVPNVAVAGEKVPMTSMFLGKKYTEAFGTFAGAGAPAAWYENYNADTRHINWGGIASDLGHMGAFGLAIQTIPFAWGVLKAKVARGTGKSASAELTMADYNSALESGLITPDEHAWIKDYIENPLETSDLGARASKILADSGIKHNTVSGEVPVEIVNGEQIQNLKSAMLDQSIADMPENLKTTLSDYIVHNGIDSLRENPGLIDGLRGFRDFIDEKLKHKLDKLEQANKMLDEYLTKSVKENMPFSQAEIFKVMKKFGFETSHIKNIPITIPENLQIALKRMEEIGRLEEKVKYYEKRISQGKKGLSGKLSSVKKHIERLKSKIPKTLTPKEELQQIREKLLGKEKEFETERDIRFTPDQVSIKSKFGRIELSTFNKGELRVTGVRLFDTSKSERPFGKGHGKDLYIEAIKYAKENNLKFVSDTQVSPEAMRVYESLKKMGYEFKENDTTYLKEREGREREHYAVTDAKPLFELISSPAAKRELPKNWEHSKDYHRLVDLAHVWENAKTLLDRVHLEATYERQESFRNLAHQIVEMADSNIGRFANRENVINYMKDRIKSKTLRMEPDAEMKTKVRDQTEVPKNSDELIDMNEASINKMDAKDLAKEFGIAAARFKEFKANENVFTNLIKCVLGGIGG